MIASETDGVRLKQLVVALANELAWLGMKGQRLEDTVGDAISEGRTTKEMLSVSLQGLDQLVQSLGDISRYLGGLSEKVDETITVNQKSALALIGQRDLAASLLTPRQLPEGVLNGGPNSEYGKGVTFGSVDFF